jgi:aminoglycoside phosphotransferase family enzyme
LNNKRTSVTLAPTPGAGTQLIEAMMRSEFYPHACERIELSQTMKSWFIFAGQFVYKIKKPLHFPFLDAATPAKRYRLCQDEVSLNRRLAPDVYLGVSGIAEKQGSYALVANPDPAKRNLQEFAVVMRRLPSELILDRMMASGTVSVSHVQDLAKKLAEFHARAPAAKSKVWGFARAISRLVASNLTAAREIAADSLTRDNLTTLETYARRYVISHQQTLDNRAIDGHVREGHGDLRCDSVCFAADSLAILDCVEYSEGLRYGDVASELASLAVDFDLLGRSDLADALPEAYVAEANDPQLLDLLGFYKCYRAVLRAKFETLASLQTDLPTEPRMAARTDSSRLFALALEYAGGRNANLVR